MLNHPSENGIDVNARNADGRTPLDLCDDLEKFKELAEKATPETLKNTLRYVAEKWNGNHDDNNANKIKFLMIDKKVKKEGYDKWDFSIKNSKEEFEFFTFEIEMVETPSEISNFSLALTAIYNNDSESLKAIIKDNKEVLKEANDEKNLIYYSIFHKNLEALQILVDADRKNLEEIEGWVSALERENENKETPFFLALSHGNLEALKIIIDGNPEVLKQNDQYNSSPFQYILQKYDINPSEKNKDILKVIFKKQFNRDLEDNELKKIVDFTQTLNFLKLFYNDSGLGFFQNQLEKTLSPLLPKKEDLSDGLKKDLVEIYEHIVRSETPVIDFQLGEPKDKSLVIYDAQLSGHRAYFIFHFDKDTLTKISYCDGNNVCEPQKIGNTGYINGVTTFELKEPQSFGDTSERDAFLINFITNTSYEKNITTFYNKEFTKEELEQEKIGGIKFSKITCSIPAKIQSRGNCSMKSLRLLSCYVLETMKGKELFSFDQDTSKRGGEAYEDHKELKQEIVDNAAQQLIEYSKKMERDVFFEGKFLAMIHQFLQKNSKKDDGTKFDPEFLPNFKSANNIYSTIFENKAELNLKISIGCIFKFDFDLDSEKFKEIGNLLKEKNIKIDNYFNLEKLSPKSRNNFTKTVLENCYEEQKNDFLQQIFLLDPAKRDIFFQDLNDENIKLISQTIREQKTNSSLKQDNLDQILAEVNNQVKARASRSDQFNGVSDGYPQSLVANVNAEKVTRRGPPPPYSPPPK
jgi:hypothetical protein